MSIEAFAIALHHSRASGAALVVLMGIANHDGDGGAWPAVATLAKYARTDRRNVQRYLTRLEALGEIRRLVGQGGDHSTADHRRPNLYRFMLTCPPDCDRTKNHRTKRDEPLQLDGLEDGAVNLPPKPSLELNNSSNELNPGTGARESDEKDASGGSHQPASAVVEPWSNFTPFDPCPVHASGHEYRPTEDRCRWCDIHRDDRYDPASREVVRRRDAPSEQPVETCPQRRTAPHSYTPAGRCIDCGAPSPDLVLATMTGDTE